MLGLGLGINKGTIISEGGGGSTPLFDTYEGFYGISATRQLKSGITDIERDRRSNDEAEAVIGFDGNDKTLNSPSTVDSTLGGFMGANNGFCARPYDQSGNGFVVEQLTKPSQPQVVSSGALVTSGSKAAWDNTNAFGWSSSSNFTLSDASELWIFGVLDLSGAAATNIILETSENFNNNIGAIQVNYSDIDDRIYISKQNTSNKSQISVDVITNGVYVISIKFKANATLLDFTDVYLNGVIQSKTTIQNNPSDSFGDFNLNLLSRNGGVLGFNSKAQELLIYKGDQSSNRAAIEADINAFYNIY